MPESTAELALAAIDSKLSAVVGDDGATYWLTVDKCARVDNWAAWEPRWFTARRPDEAATIYLIKGGTSEVVEHVAGSIDVEMTFFVLCGTRHGSGTVDPIAQKESGATHSQTLQNRMEKDVRRVFALDVTLGVSGVMNTEVVAVERQLPFIDGWCMVLLEGRCSYNERVP